MNVLIKKLTNGPVRHGKNFCIARIEGNQLAEIEGKWTKGAFTVSLLHQPSYIETYERYGLAGTDAEWRMALTLLYNQVAGLTADSLPLPKDIISMPAPNADKG